MLRRADGRAGGRVWSGAFGGRVLLLPWEAAEAHETLRVERAGHVAKQAWTISGPARCTPTVRRAKNPALAQRLTRRTTWLPACPPACAQGDVKRSLASRAAVCRVHFRQPACSSPRTKPTNPHHLPPLRPFPPPPSPPPPPPASPSPSLARPVYQSSRPAVSAPSARCPPRTW